MAALMVARAVSQGMSSQPPHFALLRCMQVMARGITRTFQSELSAFATVNYGPGKAAIPLGAITPQTGLSNLDPDRYLPLVQASTGFIGPFSTPFFFGVAGLVEYIRSNITVFGASVTATGTAAILGGGIVFDPEACFENMKEEAVAENIMVMRLGVHTNDPLGTIEDPTTQIELGVGDLFSQAEILLRAVSTQLTAELLNGTKSGLPVTGLFDPLGPDIVAQAPFGRFA